MNIECCEPSIYCNPTKISIQSIGTIQGNARVTFLSFNVYSLQIRLSRSPPFLSSSPFPSSLPSSPSFPPLPLEHSQFSRKHALPAPPPPSLLFSPSFSPGPNACDKKQISRGSWSDLSGLRILLNVPLEPFLKAFPPRIPVGALLFLSRGTFGISRGTYCSLPLLIAGIALPLPQISSPLPLLLPPFLAPSLPKHRQFCQYRGKTNGII